MEYVPMSREYVEKIFLIGKKHFGSEAEYSWDWSIPIVEQFLDNSFGFGVVCIENGNIAGFALVKSNYSSQRPDVAWLNYIFVDEKYRRQSLGTRLFDAVLSRLKEANKTYLIADVYARNKESIDFFKSCGLELKEKWFTFSKKL